MNRKVLEDFVIFGARPILILNEGIEKVKGVSEENSWVMAGMKIRIKDIWWDVTDDEGNSCIILKFASIFKNEEGELLETLFIRDDQDDDFFDIPWEENEVLRDFLIAQDYQEDEVPEYRYTEYRLNVADYVLWMEEELTNIQVPEKKTLSLTKEMLLTAVRQGYCPVVVFNKNAERAKLSRGELSVEEVPPYEGMKARITETWSDPDVNYDTINFYSGEISAKERNKNLELRKRIQRTLYAESDGVDWYADFDKENQEAFCQPCEDENLFLYEYLQSGMEKHYVHWLEDKLERS